MKKKQCLKCKCNKELSNFTKNKLKKDGLNYMCKMCNGKYQRDYWKNNSLFRVRKSEKSKIYQSKNKKKISERMKVYNSKHKEINNKRSKKYHLDNIDKRKESGREWYKKNKKHANRLSKLWKKNNKKSISTYNRKRRNLLYNTTGSHTEKEWQSKKMKYNNCCAYCGINEDILKNKYNDKKWHKLTRDHIIPISKDGTDYINNIVPSCITCNSIKNNNIDVKLIKL